MYYLLLSFAITFFAVMLILKTRLAHIALDEPNQRSLHTQLTPRIGGLAIMAGVLISWVIVAWQYNANLWMWIIFPLTLGLSSLIDDVYQLSIKWRFSIQLLISTVFVLIMLPTMSWWLVALLILLITWMTNLYNFMDGSDGLACGMGLFGFASYAVAAFLMNDMHLVLMTGTIATACCAFLFFNFHPAKIFMGDAGSIPLGFLAGSIGTYGFFNATWPVWFPVLVFSPFIVDATATLIKRQFAGEKVWQAHRSHYYQRLVQLGWGHSKTALAEYILMIGVAITAIILLEKNVTVMTVTLICWGVIYFILMHYIDQRWAKLAK